MTQYLRKAAAEKSDIYRAIKFKAMDYLAEVGAFKKETVMADLRLEIFNDSIRWDYIRDMIQEADKEASVDLIPMAEAYFKFRIQVDDKILRNTPALRQRIPERFIAMGHGKKTAGYVRAIPENGHFVTVVARNKNARAIGVKASATRFTSRARQSGCILPEAAETLQVEETRRKA
jgi:hypothetical protein